MLISASAYSQDEKELTAIILRRLHFDSISLAYTSRDTTFDLVNKNASETVAHVEYRAKGTEFSVRCETTRIARYTPNLSTQDLVLQKLGGALPENKRPFDAPLPLIVSLSFTGGKWKQLIEAGDHPGGAAGIRSRRGIYGDNTLALNPALETPSPWQFWERVGSSAWEAWYEGASGMPLEEFLKAPGKSRIWSRDNCVVLTHEISVPKEIDVSERVCLDIYVDEQGLIRRIEQVNRIWDRTQEEWAAVPGLGAWEDARLVRYSVAFDKIEADKSTGVQIPLSIKASANAPDAETASKAADKWVTEGRKDQEIYALTFTIPTIPRHTHDISVEREAFKINPPLETSDIELSFPSGTRIEGIKEAEAAGADATIGRPWYVRNASWFIVISSIALISIASIALAKYLGWR